MSGLNFLLAVSIILGCMLSYSIYMNIKLGLTILKFEDAVEESLDIIDERYRSISKILEMPIFFDSVEVRQVVNDIGITRDSLLKIANNISNPGGSTVEYKEIEKDAS